MKLLQRITEYRKKFGFVYTIVYILNRIDCIKEIPIKIQLRKQNYYKNLSFEEQKQELCQTYKIALKKELNIDNPSTFSEKIQWLKLYDSTKQKADLTDKYLAPKIISKQYSNRLKIVKQLGVWDRAEDIDFGKLPEKFVLKCNHGSAMNIIVKDKSKLNISKTRKKLNDWLKIDYAYVNGMYENHYTFINRKIIAEEFIEEIDGNLHDYKFHCFMGEPKYIEFIGDRVINTHTVHDSIYTIDWKLTDIHMNEDIPYEKEFDKPEKLNDMIQLAKEMSKPFPYVRVDFYYINNQIYFGEMTFTPDSGFINFNRDEIDFLWGSWIKLPE